METRTKKYLKGNKYYDYRFKYSLFWDSGRFFVEDNNLKAEISNRYTTITITFNRDGELDIKSDQDFKLDSSIFKQMTVLVNFAEQVFSDPQIYNKEDGLFYEDELIEFVEHIPTNDEELIELMNLIDQGKIQDSIDFSL